MFDGTCICVHVRALERVCVHVCLVDTCRRIYPLALFAYSEHLHTHTNKHLAHGLAPVNTVVFFAVPDMCTYVT
jgi:hypothetical protein